MLLSKQPGDTGVFATATSSRIVTYDLQRMSPADFFSSPWYSSTFGTDQAHATGLSTSPAPAVSLSTQALHVSGAARRMDLSARLASRQTSSGPVPFGATAEYSGTHYSSGPPSLHAAGRGGVDSDPTGAAIASSSVGHDAAGATAVTSMASVLHRWGPPLPPRLVIDLRAPHHGAQAMHALGDASFAGSAMATTAAGHVPSSHHHRPASGADDEPAGAFHARHGSGAAHFDLAPPLPAPSSVPSQENQTGLPRRSGGGNGRSSWPAPAQGYSQYTGSLVNNSFLSASANSYSGGGGGGGGGGLLPEPASLSLSSGTPQFQLFMSDRSGAAWIGTSTCPMVTRIHVRHPRQHVHRGRGMHQSTTSRPTASLPGVLSQVDASSPLRPTHAAPRQADGVLDGEDDGEDEDEEADNSGEADTNGESSGIDATVIQARRGSPSALFPSRVTASGWDPRSATTLALGRQDGIVQLLDVEYLVGGHRYAHGGGGGGGADVLTGASGMYGSDADDEDAEAAALEEAEDQETELATGRAGRTATQVSSSSHNGVPRPPAASQRPRRRLANNAHTHHTYLASGSAGPAGSAARIEYSTVQQCQLEGPVTALDWIPLSHSAVVASRRQSGLGYSMRVLDLRTPDKGVSFGGDGVVLCYAEQLACDPSQRFVATVASEAQRDVVQLWDVRLTAKPLTHAAYSRVGYTSLCWTGNPRTFVDGGSGGTGGAGGGGDTITLLGVTRRGAVRLHDFTEDSNGFLRTDDRFNTGGGPTTGPLSRHPHGPRTHPLVYARCSLDEDRAGGDTMSPPPLGNRAVSEGPVTPSTQSSTDHVSAARTTTAASVAAGVASDRAMPSSSPEVMPGTSTGRLALRLPVRVPTAAVAWVAAPLPAHPATGAGADDDGALSTFCTPGRLVGRGSRVDLPITLLLHEQTGEVYAQVYNRYGAVAAVASVMGHVLVATGPNILCTNVALHGPKGLSSALALTSAHRATSLTLSARPGQAGRRSGQTTPPSPSHAHQHKEAGAGNAAAAAIAEGRLNATLTRAQLGFSADPLRNLAILLEQGTDKEAFVLFRYGVVLARQLFPAVSEDGTPLLTAQPDPRGTERSAATDGEEGRSGSRATPLPPVPIGQSVPGMLELINAEWQQRAYLGLLDVPLPLRTAASASSWRRAARPRNGEDDDTEEEEEDEESEGSEADDDDDEEEGSDEDSARTEDDEETTEAEDDDEEVEEQTGAETASGSRYTSHRSSQLEAASHTRTLSSSGAASRLGSGLEKVPKKSPHGTGQEPRKRRRRHAEGTKGERTRRASATRTTTGLLGHITGGAGSATSAANALASSPGNKKVTLPDLRLFRGRPLAIALPGMLLVGSPSGSVASPRDALINGSLGGLGGRGRHLLRGALGAGLRGAGAATAVKGATPTTTGPAAPPPGLAALGTLRSLLLAGLGWRRSATETASSPAAQSTEEAERVSQYFVDGDGIGAGSLQEAVERRVALLVLQDRLRSASEVVAHYSDAHPLYPTLALEISAASMAAASAAAAANAASASVPRDARRGEEKHRPSTMAEKPMWERQREMEKRLQYMHQRTTGCTFWMSLALTYIDMIVLQRPTAAPGPHAGSTAAAAANTAMPSPALSASPRPPLHRMATTSGTTSPALSHQPSPLDLALPFATLRPASPAVAPADGGHSSMTGNKNTNSTAAAATTMTAPTTTTTTTATAAAATATSTAPSSHRRLATPVDGHADGATVEFYGLHTPHVGLSHLTRSAQPAFFLKLLSRFPALPISDQLGMAVALLLPPRYTAAHLHNLREVLQTLSVRQFNATFHTDCALLDAVGGGAAVMAGMRGERLGRLPSPRTNDGGDGLSPSSRVASATRHAAEDPESLSRPVGAEEGRSSNRASPLLQPQGRPVLSGVGGEAGRVPLPPLHPRAVSPHRALSVAPAGSGHLTGGGDLGTSPPSLPDAHSGEAGSGGGGAGLAGYPSPLSGSPGQTTPGAGHISPVPMPSSAHLGSATPSPPATGAVVASSSSSSVATAGGSRLLLAAVVEGMRGSLQRYVDMTGEVQTPLCYVTAFGPTRTASYRQWREAYRGLLNEAGCYLLRSQHDLRCVKIMRQRGEVRPVAAREAFTVSQPGFAPPGSAVGHHAGPTPHRFDALLLGGHLPASAQNSAVRGPALFDDPRRAVELRCNCGQAMHATALIKGSASAATSKGLIQQIPCGNPECRQRQTPMCTVCGERLEHKATELSPDRSFTWCTTCLHGGHWCHLREWFTKHNKCPVEDCLCECGGLQDM